jgi:hypothetical protein
MACRSLLHSVMIDRLRFAIPLLAALAMITSSPAAVTMRRRPHQSR